MRNQNSLVYFEVLMLIVLCAGLLGNAIAVCGTTPGNVFITNQPLQFTVTDVHGGVVNYEIVDYFGHRVYSAPAPVDNGTALIQVVPQPLGWYQITCTDGQQTASASLGVVYDRGNAPLPADGQVCTDSASVWLVKEQDRKDYSHLIRLAGLPWVRERMSWDVEGTRGTIDWGGYQNGIDTAAATGMRICCAWQDTPAWTHANGTRNACPDDLRDLYRFSKSMSSHFAGKVYAYELWNEPDGGWWKDLGDKYAGVVKAAYLGIKAGNPQAKVLLGSICAGDTQFLHNIYESGINNYFDVFNWHSYTAAPGYRDILHKHFAVMQQYGISKRPVWMTEAGINVSANAGPGKSLLDEAGQHQQCQYIPQAITCAFSGGTDRIFYFVMPHYKEGAVQWGLLKPDLTPYPSYVAIAAATRLLGKCRYLGDYLPSESDDAGVKAYVFSTPRGRMMVAWAEKTTELSLPMAKSGVVVANVFGAEKTVGAKSGAVHVTVGPDPIYVIGLDNKTKITPCEPATLRANKSVKPASVVVMGSCALSYYPNTWAKSAYNLAAPDAGDALAKGFTYVVDIYNFNESGTAKATGVVKLALPAGWTTDQPARTVTVGPMGRETLTYHIMAVASDALQKITVRANFAKQQVTPSTSYFVADASSAK